MNKALHKKYLEVLTRMVRKGFSGKDVDVIIRHAVDEYNDNRVDAMFYSFFLAIKDCYGFKAKRLYKIAQAVDRRMEEFSEDDPDHRIENLRQKVIDECGIVFGRFDDGTDTLYVERVVDDDEGEGISSAG